MLPCRYQLETAVVSWSHQVSQVLQHDSAQPLIDGQDVGPLIELDFWMKKKSNLMYIQEQLTGPLYVQVGGPSFVVMPRLCFVLAA
jgi:hypothetical protein